MLKRSFPVLLVALVAACLVGSALAPSATAQSPVKIGVIQPLSGPVAASGNYVRMGAEIARDWINAKGGVLGRKLELQIEDNKSDPKEAASAAEKLIVRDKVPAIMGAWSSSMTLAAMPKLEEYGVPMVVETSSAASVTKRGNPWVFRISPPSEMEALGLEQYVDRLGVKRADFLAVNTDWGRGGIGAPTNLAGDAQYASVKADLAKWLPKVNAPEAGPRADETAKADKKAKKAARN